MKSLGETPEEKSLEMKDLKINDIENVLSQNHPLTIEGAEVSYAVQESGNEVLM